MDNRSDENGLVNNHIYQNPDFLKGFGSGYGFEPSNRIFCTPLNGKRFEHNAY
jgi:hypothetical protein